MSSRYLDMVRGQRRRASGFQFTAKTGLILIALIGMGASLAYWWGMLRAIHSHLRVLATHMHLRTKQRKPKDTDV
jgi:hypothetical protein